VQQLILKPKEERRLRQGHLWVFSNEVARHPQAAAGDVVEVLTARDESLGSAIYHPHSLITARLLLADLEELDRSFFLERLSAAAALRDRLFPAESCYRLVHGESDWLPGLLADRFQDYLVVQTTTTGMDRRLPVIVEAFEELFHPRGIIERNDSGLRRYEELPERSGLLFGDDPGPMTIEENGIRYRVDLLHGQKTGFFLDQKLNRQAAARYAPKARALDCFCNLGGFTFHLARAGANQVVGVDISQSAIDRADENCRLNGFSNVRFVVHDTFGFLEEQRKAGVMYDLIVLDPPSFARTKKNVGPARKGYRQLNELALTLITEGGILVTASCSFHIFEEAFRDLVNEAAVRADRRLKLLEWHHQSPDHPILPAMPETQYLKLGIYQVI
jgi:23S rRNA (cytosine1962-C5)-methyltransferase